MERSVSGLLASLPLKRPDEGDQKQARKMSYEEACTDYVTNYLSPNLKEDLTPMQWEFLFLKFQAGHVVPADRDTLAEVRMEFLGFFMEFNGVADGLMMAMELIRCGQRHASRPKDVMALSQFA